MYMYSVRVGQHTDTGRVREQTRPDLHVLRAEPYHGPVPHDVLPEHDVTDVDGW